ncbi:aspartate-semialdehyde dehydrogenase [Patescibacteria group bacterium AH-259-L07]|nr:aspartate-semialdehyde dehydrogenase [Patescibacteria group bacterium AH-259-L07]
MKNKKLKKKIPVGILGATGMVGQKFVELLINHPWFEIAALMASEKSVGKKYREAVTMWQGSEPIPSHVADMEVRACKPDINPVRGPRFKRDRNQRFLTSNGVNCKIVFSALDPIAAQEFEEDFAHAGYNVVSNARIHRMDDNVPLLVPEINPDHLELIKTQSYKGCIVTNPNCSTIGLVIALKPLLDNFGIEKVNVVTLQALSGAGYPGVASLDIVDNVIPFISGEEDKVENEPQKIFGSYAGSKIEYNDIAISAQCNRVGVRHGHLECVNLKLKQRVREKDIIHAWRTFSSEPQELNLPLAPQHPVYYFDNDYLPQPKYQRDFDKGMAVSIGRLQNKHVFDYKFVVLSHNLVRGAAGGAILNAELMVEKGYV